jgi:hypothetical protein
MRASGFADLENIHLLLDYHPNLHLKDVNNRTAFQLAGSKVTGNKEKIAKIQQLFDDYELSEETKRLETDTEDLGSSSRSGNSGNNSNNNNNNDNNNDNYYYNSNNNKGRTVSGANIVSPDSAPKRSRHDLNNNNFPSFQPLPPPSSRYHSPPQRKVSGYYADRNYQEVGQKYCSLCFLIFLYIRFIHSLGLFLSSSSSYSPTIL